MRSRRVIESLIGKGFLLMIIAVGFSYYEVVSRVERNSAGIIQEICPPLTGTRLTKTLRYSAYV